MAENPASLQELKDALRQRIFRAEWPAGTRIDEDDLRRETGATFRVVRAALKDLTEEGLLQRRQRLGTFVAKKVPDAAAKLPGISALGIVSSLNRPDFEANRYIADVLEGVHEALAPGAKVSTFAHEDSVRHGLSVVPPLPVEEIKHALQGLIGLEANSAMALDDLVRRGLAVVAVDFVAPRHTWDVVSVDHMDAGYQATRHLLELGHRRIAFAGERPNPNSNDPTWQDRHLGYAKAMIAVSREPFGAWLLDTSRDGEVVKERMLAFHREHRPTAYVLATSGHLGPALAALTELGLSCPADVSLAGADSSLRFWKTQAVSTVRVAYEEVGRMAVRLLASRLACRAMPPVRVTMPVDFVPGVTSAAPKG